MSNYNPFIHTDQTDGCLRRTDFVGRYNYSRSTRTAIAALHLGLDNRVGAITAPVDLWYYHQRLPANDVRGGVTLIRCCPNKTDIVGAMVQMFHTDGAASNGWQFAEAGSTLPVVPSALGLGTGAHLHTQVMCSERWAARHAIEQSDQFNVAEYMRTLGIGTGYWQRQRKTWGISSVRTHSCRRSAAVGMRPVYQSIYWDLQAGDDYLVYADLTIHGDLVLNASVMS